MLRTLNEWKSVFLILGALLVVGLIFSRVIVGPGSHGNGPAVVVDPYEAGEYVGDRAEVCGTVASVSHARQIGGEPTFINLERDHPNQPFTAVIWNEDRPAWDEPPEQRYANQEICVTGTIDMHDGTPQIVVSDPRQIAVR